VQQTTASMFFVSLSKSWRQSVYVLAPGKAFSASGKRSSFTSHSATTFSLRSVL
jgi:hypothetical protein